jgi:hypothetical protein
MATFLARCRRTQVLSCEADNCAPDGRHRRHRSAEWYAFTIPGQGWLSRRAWAWDKNSAAYRRSPPERLRRNVSDGQLTDEKVRSKETGLPNLTRAVPSEVHAGRTANAVPFGSPEMHQYAAVWRSFHRHGATRLAGRDARGSHVTYC